ncbi:MAG: alpha/beta hydrolase [Deltaproteobacteria bacterium]|nr:alpha/beta hydrolase [Deltaproteobacteria bacterium]
MPYLTICNLKVYYEIQGKGETIILLHHGFGCTKMWKDVFPALVEAGYQVIMYDRRGYGKSEKGDGYGEFYVSDRFRVESAEALADLKAQLGIGPCHLLGQCEGGVVAVDYAAVHPHLVRSIVTSSTQCFSNVPMAELNAMKFSKTFAELSPELRDKFTDWHGKEAGTSFNQFRLYGGEYGKECFDLRDTLQTVACPALVIYPDRSFIFEVEQGVEFYRHLRFGELMVIPDCGHNTYEERPGEYVRAVLDFMKRQASPSPRRRAQISWPV